MAITVTKLAQNPIMLFPGGNMLEFSVTFDSAYAGTTGESLGFGTATNFKTKVLFMLPPTKTFTDGTFVYLPELYRASSTTYGATAVKIRLKKLTQSVTNSLKVTAPYVTTAQDLHSVKGRILVVGY